MGYLLVWLSSFSSVGYFGQYGRFICYLGSNSPYPSSGFAYQDSFRVSAGGYIGSSYFCLSYFAHLKHRLFIAIDLPESSKGEIIFVQKELDKLGLPIVWENPDHCHITLNFLGHVDHLILHQIKSLITEEVKNIPPFSLRPLYLETLYSRHEPTILYLSLAKSEELIDLQNSLSLSLSPITPQPRKFLPHIAIGYLRRTDPVSTKRAIDMVSNQEAPVLSEFLVDHITLYKNLLSATGSTYQKLGQFVLQSER